MCSSSCSSSMYILNQDNLIMLAHIRSCGNQPVGCWWYFIIKKLCMFSSGKRAGGSTKCTFHKFLEMFMTLRFFPPYDFFFMFCYRLFSCSSAATKKKLPRIFMRVECFFFWLGRSLIVSPVLWPYVREWEWEKEKEKAETWGNRVIMAYGDWRWRCRYEW